MKTKTPTVIALILLAALAIGLYLYSTRITSLPEIAEEPTVEEEEIKGTIYLSANLIVDEAGKSIIQLTAMPESDGPFLLSAMSIKGVVKSDNNNLSSLEEEFVLTPGKEIDSWVFWDKTAYSDTTGGVVIELNAHIQNEELYPLEGEIILATIPLATTHAQQVFTFELDSEFTEFFGEDAKSEFMIKAK